MEAGLKIRYKISLSWEPSKWAWQKKQTTFSNTSLQNALSGFYLGTAAISHENSLELSLQKTEIQLQYQEKRKGGRGVCVRTKLSKVWIFPGPAAFRCKCLFMKTWAWNYQQAELFAIYLCKAVNKWLVSSQKPQHTVVIANIWSRKVVGTEQETNVTDLNIPRTLC